MDTDLILKYRPKKFQDFWNQSGPVIEIPRYIENQSLPKSMIFAGGRGTGKTSLVEVASMSLSCLDTGSVEPCYECEGCNLVDARLFCKGGRLFLHSSDIKQDVLARFKWEITHTIPPEPYDAWVCVVDEAHLLDEKVSNTLLSFIETAKHCHFIFCTTELSKIDRAIRSRSQEYFLPLPTNEEAVVALARICKAEDLDLSVGQLLEIVTRNDCIPRDCLKELQRFKGTGIIDAGSELTVP